MLQGLERITEQTKLQPTHHLDMPCWCCGKTDVTGRKKPYLKNDGRCDQFVKNGQWAVCLTCDPNNNYQN